MGKQQKVIGSLQRAIDILDLFDGLTSELGVTEISRSLEMPKSTAAGLIFTLEKNNYLKQNPLSKKYSLGFKLVERAGVILEQLDLRRAAEPVLASLRDEANESVNLAIRDGGYVTYIDRMHGDNMLRMRSEIGKREMLHSTALGKAILAASSTEEILEYLKTNKFVPLTPMTITSKDKFAEEIKVTQDRGFAFDDQENETGGRCVAAVIRDYLGNPIGAVSISIPIQRFPSEKVDHFGNMVRNAADEISRLIGAPVETRKSRQRGE